MKQVAVLLCFLVGVLVEQHWWDEMMIESLDAQTVWGECEGCQQHKRLLIVPGHGRLCFGCEWDLMVSEMRADADAVAFRCPCGSVRPRNLTCSDPDCPGAVVG